MTTRRSLTRSIPFWALVAGSAASIAFGIWLAVDKVATMSSGLLDGTATPVDVYGGQSWVTLASAFVAAGLVGLVAVLALAVVHSLLATPTSEESELALDAEEAALWQTEAPDVETTTDAPTPAAAEPAPASGSTNRN